LALFSGGFMKKYKSDLEKAWDMIKVGSWICWESDATGKWENFWEIGPVTEKTINGENLNISVKHPRMQMFNFSHYFKLGRVKLVGSFSFFPLEK